MFNVARQYTFLKDFFIHHLQQYSYVVVSIELPLLLFADVVFSCFAYVSIIFQPCLFASSLYNFTVLANEMPEILAATTVNHKGTSDSFSRILIKQYVTISIFTNRGLRQDKSL